MKAFLAHFGFNMWNDIPLEDCPKGLSLRDRARYLSKGVRFDERVWREVVDRLKAFGCADTIVVDLGEFMKFPSHPELAVEGSWEPQRMLEERLRLERMGFQVVPKLNFSTAHDAWLKEYHRMVSTPDYYGVCSDIIRDVTEVFGRPKLFHIGFDEETPWHQGPERTRLAVIRRGELWWHDLMFLVSQVERSGARAWMWSDSIMSRHEEFVKRMPRSVLQSNWYYGGDFSPRESDEYYRFVKAYEWLEQAGFDQVPCGSNINAEAPDNFERTVMHCRRVIPRERLKGFMMSTWIRTQMDERERLLDAVRRMSVGLAVK